MVEQQDQSFVDNMRQESVETLKELAPWRPGVPWWVVLVEGIVLAIIGILILLDPRDATINVALFLAAALAISGILQLWAVMRGKVPESIDALLAARAAIGIYSGAIVLLLFFLQYLNTEPGLIIFGLGSLTYGLLGLWSAIVSASRRKVSSFIDGVFFTAFGVLLIFILFAGPEQVQQVAAIVGWLAIVGGLGLIGVGFFNRSRSADREAAGVQAPVAASTEQDSTRGVTHDAVSATIRDSEEQRQQTGGSDQVGAADDETKASENE